MTDTYALSVRLETDEYEGEFYLVGDGYGTPGDVLQHVAADHILALDRTRHVEEYLLDVLNAGTNTSKTEYEALDAAVACGLHANVYYQRFSFWTGDKVVEIGHNPTESTLASIADDLRLAFDDGTLLLEAAPDSVPAAAWDDRVNEYRAESEA